ncbi:MAG: DUF2278 family protein [Solirubrobacteraceae bacterium]|nr:DUF2278 family protein [Solirubrobacteraceae bacterium]
MPLDHYGVLAGTLTSHVRDTPDDQGRWYHVNLQLSAPLGSYRCAVDVDSKQSAVGVQWKVLKVASASFAPASTVATGYHELAHTQAARALDHIRHPALIDNPGCVFVVAPPAWLANLFPRRPWKTGSNIDASEALESILVTGRRTVVWGEPFETGLGMHNVHQNQGDPLTSQWADENGIWQDGGVMVERDDGDLDAFISKFSSQASRTDDEGHPA